MLRPMLEGSCRLPVFSRRKISLQRQDASMMRDTRLNNRVRTNWSFGNIRETADGCRITRIDHDMVGPDATSAPPRTDTSDGAETRPDHLT